MNEHPGPSGSRGRFVHAFLKDHQMQMLKYAVVALISAPFVVMGLLMALRGLRARALTFASAGIILVTTMSVSAAMAVERIDQSEVASLAPRLETAARIVVSAPRDVPAIQTRTASIR